MSEIICPLCGKPNPSDLDECQYCQAPLKTGGFIAPPEDDIVQESPFTNEISDQPKATPKPDGTSSPQDSIPDWLKQTEAGFLEPAESSPKGSDSGRISEQIESLINPNSNPSEPAQNTIDDDWLAGLLEEAGAVETAKSKPSADEPQPEDLAAHPSSLGGDLDSQELPAEPAPPAEKPDWLANLEASSNIKLEGGVFSSQPIQELPGPVEIPQEKASEPVEQPEWLTQPGPEMVEETQSESLETKPGPDRIEETPSELPEDEPPIAAAELPGWLEALRPTDTVPPTGPVEDVSAADMVTSGPLMGLRGVISARPSAIRAQKPPTYSIKLKVTEDQQARVQMMQELLADEDKPKPLPSKPIITSGYVFRLVVAIVLLLPIIWMVISNSQKSSVPQPGNIPGVVDFTQRIQALPDNAVIFIAFDYEAGFSAEVNLAVENVLIQLMKKNAYLTLAATYPSGPALAESSVRSAATNTFGNSGTYSNYANLGYIPGGTIGLRGLVTSPRKVLPYALDASNVWAGAPLQAINSVMDFAAIIVVTNDPDTGRIWIEQVGSQLQQSGTPLLFITSAQAGPLILPYYEATPAQVQGLISGITGGVAYARTLGNYQQNGEWDALSAGVSISVLIILVGSIGGVIVKIIAPRKQREP
jgi:hypothetical protein